jgi:thymidine phosphorylase
MDVKFGSGAFMSNVDDARALAESLVLVANHAGLPTSALLTDMHEPLASVAGNAVEVGYVLDYLTGVRREPRFHEVTVALSAEMLVLGGIAKDLDEGRKAIEQAVASGRAAQIFQSMVVALGGPGDLLERRLSHLPTAPVMRPVEATIAGTVQDILSRNIGVAVVALGGGRTRPQDPVDHAVGFSELAGIGERVDGARPLGIVHARTEAAAEAAIRALRHAYTVGDGPVHRAPIVLDRIGAAG